VALPVLALSVLEQIAMAVARQDSQVS